MSQTGSVFSYVVLGFLNSRNYFKEC